ncbi:Hemolysin-type calcium-binding region protein [Planktothrix serta PCC 8927]|uniref:Hemolysin-type calcium-binding region protein n=1 Tax=Planktothrix serta PCC 8927 TaxID=671068 RepID=A0A7Z9DY89_9CYAN|nr:calcium-binding protein [Planktothrix serta]VXD12812.1 Hemolysin-type calcium-binding region protein [Planktothrix serta PCC 8927]
MANFLVASTIPGIFALLGTPQDDNIALVQGQASAYRDGILLLEGNDNLQSSNLNDNLLINGNQGNDTLVSSNGFDTIFGGQNDDRIFAAVNNDLVFGNLGNDTQEGGANSDTLYGGQGNDTLYGDEDGDLLFGDLGNDIVDGDAGIDTLIGGAGIDTFIFDPGEASFTARTVDEIRQFEAGTTFLNGDKIAVPVGTAIDPNSLFRDRFDLFPEDNDLNNDGLNDIIVELLDGRILGVVINDGFLPTQLSLDLDFVFSNNFDFNL